MVLGIIIIYLLVVLYIGYWGMKQTRDVEDYIVGGHRLGILPSTGTYLATYLSAVSMLAGIGVVYNIGVAGAWFPIFYASGALFGPIVAARYRRVTFNTPPQFYAIRYDSRSLQVLAGIITIIAVIFSLVVQFSAIGIVWSLATGGAFIHGLLIGSLVCLAYTLMGGYMAVVWTDVFQAVVFVAVTLIGGFWVLSKVGWISGMYAGLSQVTAPPVAGGVPPVPGTLVSALGPYVPLAIFFMMLPWLGGVATHPQYLVRMQSAKDIKTALQKYAYSWVALCLIYFLFTSIGLGGRILVPTMPEGMTGDWIYPHLFMTYMPPVFTGLLFGGLLAAAMSTIDSQMVLVAGCATIDIVKNFWPGTPERSLLWISRIMVSVVWALAFVFTTYKHPMLIAVAGLSWGLLAIGFFAPTLIGLYWKRVNATSVWVSITSGLAVFLFWQFRFGTSVIGIPPVATGVFTGIVALVVATLATRPAPENLWGPFFPDR
ncbi:MAG: sodium:solute symporter family protein [Bacillota bacterium]